MKDVLNNKIVKWVAALGTMVFVSKLLADYVRDKKETEVIFLGVYPKEFLEENELIKTEEKCS